MECTLEIFSSYINLLNISDDTIVLGQKVNNLAEDFLNFVLNEDDLRNAFQFFNQQSLKNCKYAQNFALFFTSYKLQNFAVGTTNVRTIMMDTLQQNFLDADNFKEQNICYFYNSVTLLGEYYNRARDNDNKAYGVLGQALLDLLIQELKKNLQNFMVDSLQFVFDVKFAKLILSQVTLNGILVRTQFKNKIEELLYEIRTCLIQILNLSDTVKAFFLMTLDLYYNNFRNLGNDLETFYAKYLIDYENEHLNNNGDEVNDANNTQNIKQNEINNLTKLKDEVIGFKKGLENINCKKLNHEHIGKPLKLTERLKFIQLNGKRNITPETTGAKLIDYDNYSNNCNNNNNSISNSYDNWNDSDTQINNNEVQHTHYPQDHYVLNNIIETNNNNSNNMNTSDVLNIVTNPMVNNFNDITEATLTQYKTESSQINNENDDEINNCEYLTGCSSSNNIYTCNRTNNINCNNIDDKTRMQSNDVIKPKSILFGTLYSDRMASQDKDQRTPSPSQSQSPHQSEFNLRINYRNPKTHRSDSHTRKQKKDNNNDNNDNNNNNNYNNNNNNTKNNNYIYSDNNNNNYKNNNNNNNNNNKTAKHNNSLMNRDNYRSQSYQSQTQEHKSRNKNTASHHKTKQQAIDSQQNNDNNYYDKSDTLKSDSVDFGN